MLKLVVACALFAAAAAKPGLLVSSPLSPLTSIISPAVTTYTNQATNIVHPSPIVYSAPWSFPHYIKKRNIALGYITPSTYVSTSPIAATTYTSPFYHTAPAITLPLATTHFIKKRSAPLLSTTYIAPATSLVPSTYTAAAPLISTPYLTSSPLFSQHYPIATHFIKKRSASPQLQYVTPGSYSHQSKIDQNGASWVSTHSAPIVYSTPFGPFFRVI